MTTETRPRRQRGAERRMRKGRGRLERPPVWRLRSTYDNPLVRGLHPGHRVEFGPFEVDEAEVIDFGQRFDPQPFHVDPIAAAAGPYGGLIASGWHTCALMRLLAEQYLSPASSLGSPGIDELRWILPVRPGDTLTLKTTVREARQSRSKPDRGLIRTHVSSSTSSVKLSSACSP